jgi:hypothetical protein
MSQARSREQAADAAASPDPAAAAAAFHESQVREANRNSHSQARARQAQAAAAARPGGTGAQLDALLDADAFTPEDMEFIFANYEKNASAALAFFSANTAVAFGTRSAVNMDAQLWDALGDPTDLSSAANGVPDSVKTECINKYMTRATSMCCMRGMASLSFHLITSDFNIFLDTACR